METGSSPALDDPRGLGGRLPSAPSPVRSVVCAALATLFWLVLLSYIDETQQRLVRAPLLAAWIFLFCWIHVFKGSIDNIRGFRLPDIGIRRSHWLFLVAGLATISFISRPWSWAFVGGACESHLLYSQWMQRKVIETTSYGGIGGLVLLLLSTATYPLVEEFAFRRWLFIPLQQSKGVHFAVAVTSVLFALSHLRPATFAPDLLFGLLLGYSLVVTGTLLTPFLIHYFSNLALLLMSGPLSGALARILPSSWFDCGPSFIVHSVSLFLMFGALAIVARKTADDVVS